MGDFRSVFVMNGIRDGLWVSCNVFGFGIKTMLALWDVYGSVSFSVSPTSVCVASVVFNSWESCSTGFPWEFFLMTKVTSCHSLSEFLFVLSCIWWFVSS